jgi:hypothetical protein
MNFNDMVLDLTFGQIPDIKEELDFFLSHLN